LQPSSRTCSQRKLRHSPGCVTALATAGVSLYAHACWFIRVHSCAAFPATGELFDSFSISDLSRCTFAPDLKPNCLPTSVLSSLWHLRLCHLAFTNHHLCPMMAPPLCAAVAFHVCVCVCVCVCERERKEKERTDKEAERQEVASRKYENTPARTHTCTCTYTYTNLFLFIYLFISFSLSLYLFFSLSLSTSMHGNLYCIEYHSL